MDVYVRIHVHIHMYAHAYCICLYTCAGDCSSLRQARAECLVESSQRSSGIVAVDLQEDLSRRGSSARDACSRWGRFPVGI